MRRFFFLAAAFQGAVCVVALLLTWGLGLPGGFWQWELSWWSLGLGMVATAPLLLVSVLIMRLCSRRVRWLSQFEYLRRRVLLPLVRHLSFAESVAISVIAGFGEELLFRGVLAPYLGMALSSALFAFAHLGPAVLRLYKVAVYYFLAGLYFAALVFFTRSLSVAVVAHAAFDVAALYYLRRALPDFHQASLAAGFFRDYKR